MSRKIRLVVVALAAALVLSATPAFGYVPAHVRFTGASFADANSGYLSGRLSQTMGFVSTTRDGGATWSLNAFPSGPIGSVASWGGSGAIAGPLAGGFAYTNRGVGAPWIPSKPMTAFFDKLGSVGVLGSGALVAVGRSSAGGAIVTSVDEGLTWSPPYVSAEQLDPKGEPTSISELRAVDGAGGSGWVVGDRYSMDKKSASPLILNTVDSGVSWVPQASPAGNVTNMLVSVTAASADAAFAGRTDGSVIKTVNGGQNWTVATPAFVGASVNAIDSRGTSLLVAAGPSGNVAWSTNGGTKWERDQMANGKHLYAVSMLSDTTWIVAGDGFSAYRTTDAGKSWSSLSPQKTVAKPTVSAPYAAAPIVHAKTRTWYGYIAPRHDPRVASVKLTFQKRGSSGSYGAYTTKYASVSDYKSENKSRYGASVSLKSTGTYRVKATYVSEWGGTITSSWRTFSVK
jgi:photosystem II stability/assembly factor-like uncharacterized protein